VGSLRPRLRSPLAWRSRQPHCERRMRGVARTPLAVNRDLAIVSQRLKILGASKRDTPVAMSVHASCCQLIEAVSTLTTRLQHITREDNRFREENYQLARR